MRALKLNLLVILLISISGAATAQTLEEYAKTIKRDYPNEYDNTIRKHALEEWGGDYRMVLYEINKQAEALQRFIWAFESEHTSIAFNAIREWTYDGYLPETEEKLKNVDVFNMEKLVGINCDWRMAKYEYDKQVKAKNAF